MRDLQTNEVVAVGKVVGKLYILDQGCFNPLELRYYTNFLKQNNFVSNCISETCNNIVSSDVNTIKLWHQRLGHASEGAISHLPFITKSKCHILNDCDICPMTKQTRLPFSKSKTKAENIFDLIHLDSWGPYNHTSLTGARYFLKIVDDFSRATWTFFSGS